MTFKDLPSDLKNLPLTDPALAADVIDLIIGEEARASGAIGFMLCDARDRGLQPVVLPDVPDTADADGLHQLLEHLLPLVAEEGGSVLVGRGRRRGLTPSDTDREWHELTIAACARHGVRLLGYYLATADGIVALPEPLTVAS
jgi:hypothetical protein